MKSRMYNGAFPLLVNQYADTEFNRITGEVIKATRIGGGERI